MTLLTVGNPILWLVATLSVAVLVVCACRYFRPEARQRRRRDRSHGSVISRRRGPTIRLAVKVDEPKRKRKR